MSKQCFTGRTLERYQGTISRTKRQYLSASERIGENSRNISQLTKDLSVIDSRVERVDGEKLRPGPKTLNDKTLVEFVRDALARARRPLTVSDILIRIERLGWVTKSTSYKIAMTEEAVYTNVGKLFRRVGRGQYILIR